MDEQFIKSGKAKPDHGLVNSPESKLMGSKISEIPGMVKKANPATYISKDDPPFFIQHGKEDQLVPVEQSIIFAQELQKTLGKEKVSLQLLDNTKHGGPQFETTDNLNKVFGFLEKYLK
jgi:dipeptidyl aminopeptidase/acylaminoacyl peptidase